MIENTNREPGAGRAPKDTTQWPYNGEFRSGEYLDPKQQAVLEEAKRVSVEHQAQMDKFVEAICAAYDAGIDCEVKPSGYNSGIAIGIVVSGSRKSRFIRRMKHILATARDALGGRGKHVSG